MRPLAALSLAAALARTGALTLAGAPGGHGAQGKPPTEGIRFDNVTETYCGHLPPRARAGAGGKKLLFVQSGPHMGSSLLHEFMSLFSGATLLCRGPQGYHMEWTESLEPARPGIRQDLIDQSWAKYVKVRDPRKFAGPPPVDLAWMEKSVGPYIVYGDRPVLVLKDPVSVFWTAPLADHFKRRVRFLVLVREPYCYSQVVKRRYFDNWLSERKGYEGAGRMVSSILMLAVQASVWPQSLLLRYEDFAENPKKTFSEIEQWFPEIGTAKADPSSVMISVHKKLSKIANMNQNYLKLLTNDTRAILTKIFLPMNSTFARLGYPIDTGP